MSFTNLTVFPPMVKGTLLGEQCDHYSLPHPLASTYPHSKTDIQPVGSKILRIPDHIAHSQGRLVGISQAVSVNPRIFTFLQILINFAHPAEAGCHCINPFLYSSCRLSNTMSAGSLASGHRKAKMGLVLSTHLPLSYMSVLGLATACSNPCLPATSSLASNFSISLLTNSFPLQEWITKGQLNLLIFFSMRAWITSLDYLVFTGARLMFLLNPSDNGKQFVSKCIYLEKSNNQCFTLFI